MNDLLSSNSFSQYNKEEDHQNPSHIIEMSKTKEESQDLENFFKDVEGIKEELKRLETLHNNLQESHEKWKTLHNAESIKKIRSQMESQVSSSLKAAKQIKQKLDSLHRSNTLSLSLPNCGPGSSSDRTRTSVLSALRSKLHVSMTSFVALRQTIASEYRETVQRRYFTITGEKADEKTVDALISSGQSERLVERAIQEQGGKGQVMETVMEIQERHEAVKGIQTNLKELHQVFMDMAVLVETQGEGLDNIQNQVERASSFVRVGAEQLVVAKKTQRNTRKWYCYAILLFLIIIAIIVFSIRPWK